MGSYVGIIGSQLNCLEKIRRCRLLGGGVSVGVEFEDSKVQARPAISPVPSLSLLPADKDVNLSTAPAPPHNDQGLNL